MLFFRMIDGMLRYGTVRYGRVRYVTVRYGTVRCGRVRCGAVRYGALKISDKFALPIVYSINNIYLSFLAFCTIVQNLLKILKKNPQKLEFQTWYRYRMLEKGTLHFHDFDRISKTYPQQSLKIKKGFKDVSGQYIRGIPVSLKFL